MALYYYDRYSVGTRKIYVKVTDSSGSAYTSTTFPRYRSYSLNKYTGDWILSGKYRVGEIIPAYTNSYGIGSGLLIESYKTVDISTAEDGKLTGPWQSSYTRYDSSLTGTETYRGSLIDRITAEDGTYPVNGISGGYWYVRQGLANATPTITLSTTDSRTLYENDIITLTGNARDENNGDVVTIRYSINGASDTAIKTAISDTSNIPFNKTLTFKNNRLYDNTTAVTGILEEGTKHFIKVWATDDKSAKSTERTISFYVVPNRPATLTINPFSNANDLINTDTITIEGNVVDPDENNTTVSYRIENGSFIEIYDGEGGDFTFDISLNDLKVGKNNITVQAKDTYGAITNKSLEITKSKDDNLINRAVLRYDLKPQNETAQGIVLWIEREIGDLDVDVNISMTDIGEEANFVPMIKASTAYINDDVEEDQFTYEAGAEKEKILLEIIMTRDSVESDKGITLISGVLS